MIIQILSWYENLKNRGDDKNRKMPIC